jgi:hypothetical protein
VEEINDQQKKAMDQLKKELLDLQAEYENLTTFKKMKFNME